MEALKKIPSLDLIRAHVGLVNTIYQWCFLGSRACQLAVSLISHPQHGRMCDATMNLMLMSSSVICWVGYNSISSTISYDYDALGVCAIRSLLFSLNVM